MQDIENLDDIPIELAAAIRAVWRQAEAFAAAGSIERSGLMPQNGSLLQRLNTYDERFLRLQMKLDIISSALKTVRSINPKEQPRLYNYMVTLFLDVLKYDIRDASNKTGLRRMIERSWKRLTGDYLR